MWTRLSSSVLLLGCATALGCGDSADAPPPSTSPILVTGAGGSGSSATSSSSGGDSVGPGIGGAGGAGGAGPTCAPAGPFDGPEVSAADGEWTWVSVPGSLCRDGSRTGFGIRRSSASDKLFIYLEGGGACFNGLSCAANVGSFGEGSFDTWKGAMGQTGIFDTERADNPLRDWNAVYVPYCTGDIHGGDADHVDVEGFGSPKNQSFVGYGNVGRMLNRVVPTFSTASQVLLTGASAGGFGAAYNFDRVAEAFCPIPVTLLDDSGPPMADDYLAPCLQKQWKELWNLGSTLPADCPDCNANDGGGIVNYTTYIAKKYPQSKLGLVSSSRDSVISFFFGFGQNDCGGLVAPLSGDAYAAGLDDLRDNYLSQGAEWSTYFVDSTTHTYLIGQSFYTTEVQGTKLSTWVGDLVDGEPAADIGP